MRGNDHFRSLGPTKRLGELSIVDLDVSMDLISKFRHVGEDSSIQRSPFELRKPRFDRIQPTGAGRREVQVKTRIVFQPAAHRGCPVRAAVVQDQVKFQGGRRHAINLSQKGKEFCRSMATRYAAHYFPSRHVKSRVQAASSVSLVVVGSPLHLMRLQRKHRLRSVQSLNLGLLIDGKDHGVLRRIQVETHDILYLFSKIRIFADLKVLQSMRFQVGRLPDLLDLVHRHASVFRHQPEAPVGRFMRDLLNCHLQNGLSFGGAKLLGLPRSRAILKAVNSLFLKAALPLVDSSDGEARPFDDLFGSQAITREQDDLSSVYQLLWGIPGSHPGIQAISFRRRNLDCFVRPCHARSLSKIDS